MKSKEGPLKSSLKKPFFSRLLNVSLRTKLVTAFAVILVVPCMVLGLLSYQKAESEIGDQLVRSAKENVDLLDSTINTTIEPKLKDVGYLSLDLVSVLSNGDLIKERLDRYMSVHSELQAAYVGTESGQFYLSPVMELPDDFDPRTRPWYLDAMNSSNGEAIITAPYIDTGTGNIVVTIAQRMKDGSAVMALDLNLKQLAETAKQANIGKKGYTVLLDGAKNYLVHPTEEIGSQAKAVWVADLYKQAVGQFEYPTDDGHLNLTIYRTNELTSWKLAGVMSDSEIEEAAGPILKQTVVVLILALLAGAVIVTFIVLSITRPIKQLVGAADKISQGDLTERISIKKRRDEIGLLAESFNKMSDSLRGLLTNLGESVSQLAASSEQLNAGAEQTSKATEHIAEIVQEVSQGSEKQVGFVQESVSTVKAMSEDVAQISENARKVSTIAVQAAHSAEGGNETVQTAVSQMNSINDTVNEMARSVKVLEDRIHEIGQITEMIGGIANQTNLLALNASIEAARAGENGRGFAVVATEVRKLAEQSSRCTQQIGDIISAVRTETNQVVRLVESGKKETATGIEVVHDAGNTFDEISRFITEVSGQIQEVSAASQQMAPSAQRVADKVNQIFQVAETNAAVTQNVSAATEEQLASMEEVAALSSQLSKMAEELQQLVGKFKL